MGSIATVEPAPTENDEQAGKADKDDETGEYQAISTVQGKGQATDGVVSISNTMSGNI
jgi:hypothetical protein